MANEKTVTVADREFVISKLPLEDSMEVLLRLMKLGGGAPDVDNMGAVLAQMSMKDLRFLQEKLLGTRCHMINDTGDGVPLGPRTVATIFDGHPGRLVNLLLQCLAHNYTDFLADLDLPGLAAGLTKPQATEPEAG